MRTFTAEIDSLPTAFQGVDFDALDDDAIQQKEMERWRVGCPYAVSPTAVGGYSIVKPASDCKVILLTFSSKNFTVSESTERCRDFAMHSLWSQTAGAYWVHNINESNWLRSSAARLNELGSRPDGWKGDGSVAPKKETIEDGLLLLDRLRLAGCSDAPMISADDDGEVIFFWKKGEDLLSLSLVGGGKYSFFARKAGKGKLGDDVPISKPIPVVIRHILADLRGI